MRAGGEEMSTWPARAGRRRRARLAAALAAVSATLVPASLGACPTAAASGMHRGRVHAAHARNRHRAHAAHTLRASDRATLRYRSAKGSTLYETGRASGSLPGSMRVHMRVAATFTGTFTIHARGGTITGRGRAIPHGSGVIESFKGVLTVTSGSGRYRHAHGHANLYGTFNRRTYALTIHTAGTLHY